MSFDEDLTKAKKTFKDDQDQEQIKKWELEHKKASLFVNLGKHPSMQEIIAKLQEDLVGIDLQLNEQEVVSQEDILKRLNLKDKKELYNWFLGLFSGAKTTISAIEKDVQDNLQENASSI